MLYFDHAATTPVFPEALEAYTSAVLNHFGNPSSKHEAGFSASRLLEKNRQEVLSILKLEKTHGCLFCSGATESNNLAIKGVAFSYANRGKKILISSVEHPSVKQAALQLQEKFGYQTILLPVNESGIVTKEILSHYIDKETILVSLMAVNNETGAIFPIKEIGEFLKGFPKCFFHVDATQSIGKIDIDYSNVDLLSFSAHKFGGMKGSGALLYKKSIKLLPQHSGGEQEMGLRAGTVDVPSTCALSVALKKAISLQKSHLEKETLLRDYLKEKLQTIEEISFNSPSDASPYVLNFSLRIHKASVIAEALSEKGICISSVSACSSKGEPSSYVLEAMGKSKEDCMNSLRVSMSPESTKEEIDYFVETLQTIFKEVRPR